MQKLEHIESFSISHNEENDNVYDKLKVFYIGDSTKLYSYLIENEKTNEKFLVEYVDQILDYYENCGIINIEDSIESGRNWFGKEQHDNEVLIDIDSFYRRNREFRPDKYYNGSNYELWPDYIKNFHAGWNIVVWDKIKKLK